MFFINFLNNLAKYVTLLNHNILIMISKSYLNLVYVIWMKNKMDGWTKRMVRWVNGWKDVRLDRWLVRWLDGWKVRWMD